MKKYLALILCAVMTCVVFAACSKDKNNDPQPDNNDGKTPVASEIVTSDAAVTGSAAIALLKSYEPEELGLKDVKDTYQFMLSTVGSEIDGKKYIRAEAGDMVESGKDDDGKTTYSMKSFGTFFISYDGTKILIQKDDDKYDTIKVEKERLDKVTTAPVADSDKDDKDKKDSDKNKKDSDKKKKDND